MTRLPPTCLKGCLAFHLILSSACRTAQAGFRSYAQQKGKKKVHIYAPSAILLCICNEMLRRRNKKEIESPLRKKCISNPTLSTCAIVVAAAAIQDQVGALAYSHTLPFLIARVGNPKTRL